MPVARASAVDDRGSDRGAAQGQKVGDLGKNETDHDEVVAYITGAKSNDLAYDDCLRSVVTNG